MTAGPVALYRGVPSPLGRLLEPVLDGPHMIYELRDVAADVDRLLPERLTAFGKNEATATEWAKQHLLYRRGLVCFVRRQLATRFRHHLDLHVDTFAKTLRPGMHYNYVVCGNRIVAGRIFVRSPFVDNMLSKHVLLSGFDDDVRYAGEGWVEPDGELVFNNGSGTYKPDPRWLPGVATLLSRLFDGLPMRPVAVVPD